MYDSYILLLCPIREVYIGDNPFFNQGVDRNTDIPIKEVFEGRNTAFDVLEELDAPDELVPDE